MITKTFTFDGKRYYVRGSTEEQAIKKMTRKQMELEQGLIAYTSKMPVSDWAREVLKTYKADLSSRALYDMTKRIEKHILEDLGNIPIGKVKPIHCQ